MSVPLPLSEPVAAPPAPEVPRQRAAAHGALRSGLARILQASAAPECARLLGPLVPGATLPGGTRVPGTSFELDPAQAAFNLALLLRWGQPDPPPGLPDQLAPVLSIADWSARRAMMEGREPDPVGRLLDALDAAQTLAMALAPLVADPARRVALTSEAVAAALLAGHELGPGSLVPPPPPWPQYPARATWPDSLRHAEASADGVLRALRARRCEPVATAAEAALAARTPRSPRPEWSIPAALDAVPWEADAFTTAVLARFPPKRAGTLLTLCADRPRLELTPVGAFMALLVAN